MTTVKRRRGESFEDHMRNVRRVVDGLRTLRDSYNQARRVYTSLQAPPAYRERATAAERGAAGNHSDRLNPPPSYRRVMAGRSTRRRNSRVSRRSTSGRSRSVRPRVRAGGRRKGSRRPPSRRRRVVRRRVARISRVNRFVTRGVILKREAGGIISDNECAYLGHNSTAMGETWRAISWAICRWFARKLGQDITSFDAAINGLAVSDPNLAWRITYKTISNGSVTGVASPTLAQSSWSQMADLLYTLIQAQIGLNDYFDLIDVELYSPDNVVGVRDLTYTRMVAKEFIVTVVGNSSMMLQNATLATNVVGDDDAELVTNVNNNPLHGKKYFGFGQNYPMNFQDGTAGVGNLCIETGVDTGFLSFNYGALGAVSNSAGFSLQKPPPYYKWAGMVGNKYVRVNPGEIFTSKIVKSYTMNLNKWIQMCIPYLKNGPEGNRNNIKFLGKSVFFGLEKMLDSRNNEPPIRIAFELNLTTSAIGHYKPNVKLNPQVNLVAGPINYGPV